MKTDSEGFEAFPDDENTAVLAHGFYGGFVSAIVFGVFVAFYATATVGAYESGLVVFFGALFFLVFYYAIVGAVCFLAGLGVSHLIGHRLDLRLVATLTACCTAYLPAMLIRNVPIEDSVVVGLWFSIPMSFAAIGAWVAADREFRELKVESVRSRQFDLKLLFGVTLILAALMSLRALLNLEASFFIGFFVALVPTSIFTALVAWVRAIVKNQVTATD